jgi:hypothetical protein
MKHKVRVKETGQVVMVEKVDRNIHGRLIGGSFSHEELMGFAIHQKPSIPEPIKKVEKEEPEVEKVKPKKEHWKTKQKRLAEEAKKSK